MRTGLAAECRARGWHARAADRVCRLGRGHHVACSRRGLGWREPDRHPGYAAQVGRQRRHQCQPGVRLPGGLHQQRRHLWPGCRYAVSALPGSGLPSGLHQHRLQLHPGRRHPQRSLAARHLPCRLYQHRGQLLPEPYIYSAPSKAADCPSGHSNAGVSCYREPYIYSAPSIVASCTRGTNFGLFCSLGGSF